MQNEKLTEWYGVFFDWYASNLEPEKELVLTDDESRKVRYYFEEGHSPVTAARRLFKYRRTKVI